MLIRFELDYSEINVNTLKSFMKLYVQSIGYLYTYRITNKRHYTGLYYQYTGVYGLKEVVTFIELCKPIDIFCDSKNKK